MSFKLDLGNARKRLDIENQLLEHINSNLSLCLTDINWIKNNCLLSNSSEDFANKVFDCANQLYSGFTFFYLKRKDFMGMNLTGIIDKKIETGLSFKNSLSKCNFTTIKKSHPEQANTIETILTNSNVDSLNYYKIMVENFNLHEHIKPKFIIIVCDIQNKNYWLFHTN